VIVGVSVGAMNSGLFAFYEKGDEINALHELEKLWTTYLI
jgi:predicted acylesterase/phospholipase RssA